MLQTDDSGEKKLIEIKEPIPDGFCRFVTRQFCPAGQCGFLHSRKTISQTTKWKITGSSHALTTPGRRRI